MFHHYCATTGPSFRAAANWHVLFSTGVLLTSIVFAWLVIPTVVVPSEALGLALTGLYPNAVAADTNANFEFVTGLDAAPVDVGGLRK